MKIIGLGKSVYYEISRRAGVLNQCSITFDIPLDGKAMDAIAARKRWRKAPLWAKSVPVIHERWMRCYEPGAGGMKRTAEHFEQVSGKCVCE